MNRLVGDLPFTHPRVGEFGGESFGFAIYGHAERDSDALHARIEGDVSTKLGGAVPMHADFDAIPLLPEPDLGVTDILDREIADPSATAHRRAIVAIIF